MEFCRRVSISAQDTHSVSNVRTSAKHGIHCFSYYLPVFSRVRESRRVITEYSTKISPCYRQCKRSSFSETKHVDDIFDVIALCEVVPTSTIRMNLDGKNLVSRTT